MDEATRRNLLFGKELPEEQERTSRRLGELAEGMAGGLEGVRNLQQAGYEPPDGLEYEQTEDGWSIEPTVEAKEQISGRARLRLLLVCLGIFAVALLPRIYFLYFVTDPDVMILSCVPLLAGALNIISLSLIGRRFWSEKVGIAAAAVAILTPIVIFNDP